MKIVSAILLIFIFINCTQKRNNIEKISDNEIQDIKKYQDSDNDDFPDCIELNDSNDRKNFIGWFTTIAESEYYMISDNWDKKQQDCAGLIRFAWRESLKKHNDTWLKKFKYLSDTSFDNIKVYNYPDLPIIKDKIFKIKNSSFSTNDVDKIFSDFADAKNLIFCNTKYISKNYSDAEKGDLLFYQNQESEHIMIVLNGSIDKKNIILVYHDGDLKKGKVKRIKLNELLEHPDYIWHPLPENNFFIGVFRLSILI